MADDMSADAPYPEHPAPGERYVVEFSGGSEDCEETFEYSAQGAYDAQQMYNDIVELNPRLTEPWYSITFVKYELFDGNLDKEIIDEWEEGDDDY